MSIREKIKYQKFGIDRGDILPTKSVFPRTQTKEIISSQLYLNLQRSLSPQEYFFKGNNSLFKKNDSQYNRRIYQLFQSYIVVDPDKIPKNFIKLFELDPKSENIHTHIDDIFRKSRLLDKKSARIVFVEDKIVIFRNEERLVHKEGKKLTQGEKRRSEIVTTFNTFSNIYDAVRSQYHTIESSQDKQDDCKLLQQDILNLAQEIQTLGYGIKDLEFKRRLDSIISDTQHATNFKVLAANLQNLQELTFTNKSIDSKLLQGAKNKLNKRFKDLQNIIGIVTTQLNDLENILTEHQNALDFFLSQIIFTNKQFSFDNYNKSYLELEKKYGLIAPFCTFHKRINKYHTNPDLYKIFLQRISTFFEIYQKEHQQKISGKETKIDIELFEDFKNIKDNLPYFEELIAKN